MEKSYKKVAVDAALKSGRFIKNSVGRINRISYKGKGNIVTDVDKKAEEMIIGTILSAFPAHSILSEERGVRRGSRRFKWIIDPLDGTTNFAHAFPFFAVSVALEVDGSVEMGIVYDPMRDELFYAAAGRGAYLNGGKIRVTDTAKLPDSFLATGFAYNRSGRENNVGYFKEFLLKSLAVRRAGSAALDLCYVGCGRFDGFWEMDLHPWDSAAGMIIVREAGGVTTRFDGSGYTPYDRDILATNGHIHKEMIKILSK